MILRIGLKALLLFVIFNLLFILIAPAQTFGAISLYNRVFAGRPRLPWGENPEAYNLNLNNLDAMFASHEVGAVAKPADEYRVILIGDSSTWGFLLRPEETLSAQLNAMQLTAKDGRRVRVYNVGYPDFSLTKDTLLLSRAMRYQPDLVIWLLTLRSFPVSTQQHPLVVANTAPTGGLSANLWSQRRDLADLLRLQLYGVMWSATGIDQVYPAQYERWQNDLEADAGFQGLKPETFKPSDLAFEQLARAKEIAGTVPLLIVNEPMAIADGKNSDIRYNFFYPRWVYDRYRELMIEQTRQSNVRYLDLWNAIPNQEFTNSAVHLTPVGSRMLAGLLGDEVIR